MHPQVSVGRGKPAQASSLLSPLVESHKLQKYQCRYQTHPQSFLTETATRVFFQLGNIPNTWLCSIKTKSVTPLGGIQPRLSSGVQPAQRSPSTSNCLATYSVGTQSCWIWFKLHCSDAVLRRDRLWKLLSPQFNQTSKWDEVFQAAAATGTLQGNPCILHPSPDSYVHRKNQT